MIKIDVDGIEHLILRGAVNTLSNPVCKTVLVEVSTEFSLQADEVSRILTTCGFSLENRAQFKLPETNIIKEFKNGGGLNRSVFHALLFRLSGLGLIFLLQVMLARLMGPSNYGDYTVIITTVNLLLVLSVFGFDSSILRFLPSYIAKRDYSSVNGFVRFSYRMITILSILCSIGLFIFLLTKSKKKTILLFLKDYFGVFFLFRFWLLFIRLVLF